MPGRLVSSSSSPGQVQQHVALAGILAVEEQISQLQEAIEAAQAHAQPPPAHSDLLMCVGPHVDEEEEEASPYNSPGRTRSPSPGRTRSPSPGRTRSPSSRSPALGGTLVLTAPDQQQRPMSPSAKSLLWGAGAGQPRRAGSPTPRQPSRGVGGGGKELRSPMRPLSGRPPTPPAKLLSRSSRLVQASTKQLIALRASQLQRGPAHSQAATGGD